MRAVDSRATAEEQAFVTPLFRFPPVTAAIVVLNVVVFLGIEFLGGSDREVVLLACGAKARSPMLHGEWWRLISAGFIHIGWFHLLVNSVTLVQLGMVCENLYGRRRFVVLYLVSGMSGFLLSALMSDTLSAGASASLAGLMGALLTFGFRFYRRIPRTLRSHFTWYLLPWVVVMLGLGVAYRGIDNWAHLGGLLAGIAVALVQDPGLYRRSISQVYRWVGFLVQGGAAAVFVVGGLQAVVRAHELVGLLEIPGSGSAVEGELEVLDRFLELDPGDGFLHYLRGEARYRAGRLEGAEEDYRAALRNGYDGAGVKNALAWVLAVDEPVDDGSLEEAVRLARSAVREERLAAYLNTLGWVYYQRGDYLAAVAQLEASYRRATRPSWWRRVVAGGRALKAWLARRSGLVEGPGGGVFPGVLSAEACLDLYMLALAYQGLDDGRAAEERLVWAERCWAGLSETDPEVEPFRERAWAVLRGGSPERMPSP